MSKPNLTLRNPSTEGEELVIGQEPVIAEGVRGTWFDMPDGIWIPLIIAERPGSGDVARMLDALPRDRTVIFPSVLNARLDAMLVRRGFAPEQLGECDAMVRRAQP